MTTYPNIALTGALRSGKDSVGAYLCEKYGYVRFAFGDALKDDFHRRYPEIGRFPKPREAYQFHGQFMRKHCGEGVWVDACFRDIMTEVGAGSTPVPVVITDLRQPSEYDRCHAEGYVIIRVNAPLELRRQRALAEGDTFDDASFCHETEQHVDLFATDYDVYNVGTVEALRMQIDAIMRSLASSNVKEVGQWTE
jgi:dephospho-CoA kinase